MRQLIDIITDASQDSEGDVRGLDRARSILADMSPMDRYKLLDKLAGIAQKNGDPYVRGDARYKKAVEYIADHMAEFAVKPEIVDDRKLDDGGIHRLY